PASDAFPIAMRFSDVLRAKPSAPFSHSQGLVSRTAPPRWLRRNPLPHRPPNRPLKNVGEAGKTRQKRPKKRSLGVLNEHFEAVFNAVLPTQLVFQRPANP